ncbi:MAG: methionyl-tRNA formyltransferase [Lachnospiraceae bacterium]|nr:methionyl-tRNA formyltransferase [Lachnospiraceae bacterium]MDD7627052.1 methionyl-tRNA formyltransferase [Lachnospiraceae bacterium]MDY4118939.1 methionyl-tRNA formyltransferase [Lachnospiraceae bacterium]
MKIIYMGTPDFSVAPLEAILQAGHEVTAVVTQPDKQKGRGKEVQMTPVKECALKHGIPVLQPVKIKEPEAVAELKKYPADIFVVAAFGQLLTEEILNMPKFGCINIHASLLPAYRGAAPIQRVIINGEEKTGVTIQQMAKGLDTGDMLLKKEISIDPKETGGSLHDKLSVAGAELIVEALSKIEKGEVVPEKQDDALSCYAKKLDKAMGLIDFDQSAVSIERLIRGLNPWPSAYTLYKGKTLKIWEADVVPLEKKEEPGTVVFVAKDFFDIATKEGALRVKSLQLEGKKKVAVKDFLLGYEIVCGMKF